jgi:hypothetical protein
MAEAVGHDQAQSFGELAAVGLLVLDLDPGPGPVLGDAAVQDGWLSHRRGLLPLGDIGTKCSRDLTPETPVMKPALEAVVYCSPTVWKP